MTPRRLLVTGGAGFIGSTFVQWVLTRHHDLHLTVLDKLTYAGNVANLAEVEAHPGYRFVQADIADGQIVNELAAEHDAIVNFAAESHVDRSIEAPDAFIRTDVLGTHVLLDAARRAGHDRYVQVSTDEVYGDVAEGWVDEDAPVRPRSPYAASKAGADLLVHAYHVTYGLNTSITRGSNTFGPRQYPEKIIPLFTTNAVDDVPLPMYGDGQQRRDWIYVEDHCAAIWRVLVDGSPGAIYNVSAGNELPNALLTRRILAELGKPESLIRHVVDRPGHDTRYAVDASRLRRLGWRPEHSFDTALARTVRWYVENEAWWRPIKDGEFREYYRRQYGERLEMTADTA